MSNTKGKGAIGLALVLALAASYMVYSYLDRVNQQAKPVETVQVVTAAKDIPPRTVISSDMIQLTALPVNVKLPQAITSADLVQGKVSKLPISQGEQLLPSKVFAAREQSGLAFVVPPGKRAVAVKVDEVIGSGGLLVPGDSVDVVAVVDTKPDQNSSEKPSSNGSANAGAPVAVAQYILQNVEVLAIAQNLEGDQPAPSGVSKAVGPLGAQQDPPKQAPKTEPAAHTATLAVAAEDAKRLVLAEDKGRIRLVLRAHGDDSKVDIPVNGLFVSQNGMVILKPEPKPL